MNQYRWENINKATNSTYITCPTYPKYNPGKSVRTAPRHYKLPNGLFEVWKMDFIQIPLSHGDGLHPEDLQALYLPSFKT